MQKRESQKRKRKKIGLPPGSVIFTGNQKVDKVVIHHLQYDEKKLEENIFDNQSEITFQPSLEEQIDWYDMRGLHDTNLLESIGKTFEIHSLILEDVADVRQRPKFEEYEKGVFIIVRAFTFDKNTCKVKAEQVAVYFRKGLLISFQENESDLFAAVRNRVHAERGKVRSKGADYLAYALLDNIIDNYFVVFDEIQDMMENLEEKLLDNPDSSIKGEIHHLKKELLIVRKSISPLREAISQFSKTDSIHVEENTTMYIRDVYDHTIQIMDLNETQRDILNGMQDLYISEISFKMNQVMQVLTIITTIFVPLSFLAGLYGMNFEKIPELKYENGYFVLLGVMFLILVSSLIFFKRKKWF
ncbi:MAG: magnesium/cobalt transporter CorA [Saprospiraceae bacterium]